MQTKEDIENTNIPKLMYCIRTRTLKEWDGIEKPNWAFHHRVKRQKIKRNPELIKEQALIYFPNINQVIDTIDGQKGNPHTESDNYHSKYLDRWGIKLEETIYKGR